MVMNSGDKTDGVPPTCQSTAQRVGAARPRLTLVLMCMGMFVVLLDVTIVNVAIPAIGQQFGTSISGIQWVVTAYTIAIASLLLLGGSLGDRFGHRRVVLVGFLVFAAASAGCGLAPGMAILIASRSLQGLGAALLLPGTIAVITDLYPDRAEQTRALGIWAGISSLALPAGPLLGGLVVTSMSWQWIFLFNLPIIAVAICGILWFVPDRRALAPAVTFDVAGVALAAISLTAVTYAVTSTHRFGEISLMIACVAAIGFLVRERHAAYPVLPLQLFRNRHFSGANTIAFLMNLVTNGSLFVITLYLQEIHRSTPLAAGAALLPLFVPLAGLAPFAGRLAARYGPCPVIVPGALFAGAGEAALVLTGPTASYPALLPTLVGIGVGTGLVSAPVVAAAVGAVEPTRAGLASAANNTVRQTGTALGIAVFGTVAGTPTLEHSFLAGVHRLGVAAAAVWVVIVILAVTTTSRLHRVKQHSSRCRC